MLAVFWKKMSKLSTVMTRLLLTASWEQMRGELERFQNIALTDDALYWLDDAAEHGCSSDPNAVLEMQELIKKSKVDCLLLYVVIQKCRENGIATVCNHMARNHKRPSSKAAEEKSLEMMNWLSVKLALVELAAAKGIENKQFILKDQGCFLFLKECDDYLAAQMENAMDKEDHLLAEDIRYYQLRIMHALRTSIKEPPYLWHSNKNNDTYIAKHILTAIDSADMKFNFHTISKRLHSFSMFIFNIYRNLVKKIS